jgi:hypothetical protein
LFLASMASTKTGIYYVDSTPLPVCHKELAWQNWTGR